MKMFKLVYLSTTQLATSMQKPMSMIDQCLFNLFFLWDADFLFLSLILQDDGWIEPCHCLYWFGASWISFRCFIFYAIYQSDMYPSSDWQSNLNLTIEPES